MSTPGLTIGATVVIPTLNRGSYLLDTINDLLKQAHQPLEILVVDQSDTQDPVLAALVAEHPDIISYHRVDFRGLPIARNFGWQMARHELIIYVDDDIRCDSGFVSAHVCQQNSLGGVLLGGRILEESANDSNERTGLYSRWLAKTTAGFDADQDSLVDHVKGANFSSPRSLLQAVGGLDEALGIGAAILEETELSMAIQALGNHNHFCAAAELEHLVAGAGGTRQRDMSSYIYAFMHNRSVLIRRYSGRYQYPTAIAWSLKLIAAFTVSYRQPKIVSQGLRGIWNGWVQAARPRKCTFFTQLESS